MLAASGEYLSDPEKAVLLSGKGTYDLGAIQVALQQNGD